MEIWVSTKPDLEQPVFGSEECGHNECQALEVIEQDWSSEVGSALSRGLGARASGTELPHGNGPSLPRNEGCVLG